MSYVFKSMDICFDSYSRSVAGKQGNAADLTIPCVLESHIAYQSKIDGILDPDRLSFTATLKVLRCRLPEVPKTPTTKQAA